MVSSNSNLISNWIWGVGGTADDVRGCYDPVLVVFLSKLNLNLPSVFVEITSFEVPVFEITLLYQKRAMKNVMDFFEQMLPAT